MDKHLLLNNNDRFPITILEDVPLVRLFLNELRPVKTLKRRAVVSTGMLLATHASPNVGNLHSPVHGIVRAITDSFIEIEATPPAVRHATPSLGTAPSESQKETSEAPVQDTPVTVSFDELDKEQLATALKELGISVRPFTRPCDLFIVNGLNPDPGMYYCRELFISYKSTLEAGFALARRLSGSPRYILAVPEGSHQRLEGAKVRRVKPVYPISLARPLIRAITGSENTANVTMVRLHAIFTLGLVAESGLPLTRTLVSVMNKNYLAPIGTPISTFFALEGLEPEEGDSVIVGGVMRGSAVASLERGIGKWDEAVSLARKGSRPSLEDNPCIGCGACVSVCPMRLRPNMLSRYAEFEMYESCRKEYIEVCIECGMCGYICPACRPMQQHFRIVKHRLGINTFQHTLGL